MDIRVDRKMVRMYGPVIGNGSFARVNKGLAEGYASHKKLAGVFPIDAYDGGEDEYEGRAADVGIFIGPLNALSLLYEHGCSHSERYGIISPNSTWIPEWMVETCRSYRVTPMVPSSWAKDVVMGYLRDGERVLQLEHGIDDPFRPGEFVLGDSFAVLHLTSSSGQRKGTKELIDAWFSFSEKKDCVLTIVANLAAEEIIRYCEDRRNNLEAEKRQCPVVLHRVNLSSTDMAKMYRRHHVVAQPSRGEAFGLVPLEAAACGVPVLMTDCTGHTQYSHALKGAVFVPTGELSPIDDGPGALAPTLSSFDVLSALEELYSGWKHYRQLAMDNAEELQRKFSWREVVKRQRIHVKA